MWKGEDIYDSINEKDCWKLLKQGGGTIIFYGIHGSCNSLT